MAQWVLSGFVGVLVVLTCFFTSRTDGGHGAIAMIYGATAPPTGLG